MYVGANVFSAFSCENLLGREVVLGNGSGFYAQTMSPLIFKERVRERFLVPGLRSLECMWWIGSLVH